MTLAFAEELARFADAEGRPHLTPIIDRLRRPLRVAVVGRDGVGRSTVAAALRRSGLVVGPEPTAEVRVVVTAEAWKPEDQVVLRSAPAPAVVVLTKADLTGSGPDGPVAAARRRAAAIEAGTGVAAVPAVGLLAALDPLDAELVDALGSFVTEPANLATVDAFVSDAHPVGRDVRARLLARLDRFGIAHAVLALAAGTSPADLTAHLRHLGNLDEVMSALNVAAAPARYRRVRAGVTELHCLAIQLDDDRLTELARSDVAVLAAMTAAVEVVEAVGLRVDRRDTAVAHAERAVHWRRYGRGPVDAVHHRCGEDIARGSLRLLAAVTS